MWLLLSLCAELSVMGAVLWWLRRRSRKQTQSELIRLARDHYATEAMRHEIAAQRDLIHEMESLL